MKKYLKAVVVLLAFAFIIFVPHNVKAAQFKMSPDGSSTKCGSYYIKYNSKGIYTKKSGKSWKLIVKATNNNVTPSFTSDGKTIYYAANSGSKGVIYKIGVTGKSKKTIYNAKHRVRVIYYYGGKVCYCSDVYDVAPYGYSDFTYTMYAYVISKKKYELYYSVSEDDSTYFKCAYKNILVTSWSDEELTTGYDLYNINTCKYKSGYFYDEYDEKPEFKYASGNGYVYVAVTHVDEYGDNYLNVYRYSTSNLAKKTVVSNVKCSYMVALKSTYVKYKSTSGSVVTKKL